MSGWTHEHIGYQADKNVGTIQHVPLAFQHELGFVHSWEAPKICLCGFIRTFNIFNELIFTFYSVEKGGDS